MLYETSVVFVTCSVYIGSRTGGSGGTGNNCEVYLCSSLLVQTESARGIVAKCRRL